jgi:hypothetical protein
MAECFCGCGRQVGMGFLGRRRLANMYGAQFTKDLALFEGALERTPDPEHDAELRRLVETGRPIRDDLARLVHGEIDRKDFDREAGRAWLQAANVQRGRMAMETVKDDYVGWSGHRQSQLIRAGVAAPAVITAVADTGTTINEHPRVELTIRVEPAGEAPFEVTRKVTVSRVAIPKPGERLTLFYDPKDRERFTFKISDLTDDPAGSQVDRLQLLETAARLRDQGILTQDEFEAEKQRLMGSG